MVPRADAHAGRQVFCSRIGQRLPRFRCTASARTSALKAFVTDPISKTVSPSSGRSIARMSMAVRYHSFAGGGDDLDHDADIIFILSDAIDQDLPDCIVGW